MSIWVSIGEPVDVLNGDNDDANYRAEGEPTAWVDVAIAEGYHDHIRLAVSESGEGAQPAKSMNVILSPAAARELARMLEQAST